MDRGRKRAGERKERRRDLKNMGGEKRISLFASLSPLYFRF
jgi:hypothetical protein